MRIKAAHSSQGGDTVVGGLEGRADVIHYKEDNKRFNYRIVGVCTRNGHVLLHRAITDDFWALPGGRAELLEYSPDTLRREMKEELDVEVNVGRLLWISENFFTVEEDAWHELSLYYLFDFPVGHQYYTSAEFHGIEDDGRLLFKWYPVSELANTRLFPTFLRESLACLPTSPVHILHRDED
ncbi:MAG: NUDIX hydrolase [Thermaerobacter sp.]|nr:NUDIX hydrolase [Thermaerobacter sp.]